MKFALQIHLEWKLFLYQIYYQLILLEKFLDLIHYLKDFNVSMKIKMMDNVKIIKSDIVAIMMVKYF